MRSVERTKPSNDNRKDLAATRPSASGNTKAPSDLERTIAQPKSSMHNYRLGLVTPTSAIDFSGGYEAQATNVWTRPLRLGDRSKGLFGPKTKNMGGP